MNMSSANPINVVVFLGLISLIPVILILTTSFIKTAMVLILTRESLGVQQVPPNIVIYSLSLILSFYVMGPVYSTGFNDVVTSLTTNQEITSAQLIGDYQNSVVGIKGFLQKHTPDKEKEFFYQSLKQFWTPDMLQNVKKDDLLILIPAFMVTELTQAFKIGFLMYLPSVIIDIIVSNILMAMGMMMMSPVTIALPIKLLLFISLDGWSRLIHAILGTYS